MTRKIYKLEEIVNLLSQVEVAVANGRSGQSSKSRRTVVTLAGDRIEECRHS